MTSPSTLPPGNLLSRTLSLLAESHADGTRLDTAVQDALSLAELYQACGALDKARQLAAAVLQAKPGHTDALARQRSIDHDQAYWRTVPISLTESSDEALTTFSFPIHGNPDFCRRFIDANPLFVRHMQTLCFLQNGWSASRWMGVPILKQPHELMLYQEILFTVKPDLIIEAGTHNGGSAYFMAHMLDLIGHGEVVTIDIKESPHCPKHPRITYRIGSSVEPAIVEPLRERSRGKRVMIVLDSSHLASHVLAELRTYADLVSVGSYLIVEDSNINGNPVWSEYREPPNPEVSGPMQATRSFLAERGDFEIDRSKHRFMITNNPNGYLRRMA